MSESKGEVPNNLEPEQLELRPPIQRGGPMTEFDWRLAKAAWKLWFCNIKCEGKIKASRLSLQLSTNEMARRLKIKTNSYTGFEKRELLGSVTLAKMREIADAMGCDFEYAFVPKANRDFPEVIWESTGPEALRILEKRRPLSHTKGIVLAKICMNLLQNARFRRKQGWSERKN